MTTPHPYHPSRLANWTVLTGGVVLLLWAWGVVFVAAAGLVGNFGTYSPNDFVLFGACILAASAASYMSFDTGQSSAKLSADDVPLLVAIVYLPTELAVLVAVPVTFVVYIELIRARAWACWGTVATTIGQYVFAMWVASNLVHAYPDALRVDVTIFGALACALVFEVTFVVIMLGTMPLGLRLDPALDATVGEQIEELRTGWVSTLSAIVMPAIAITVIAPFAAQPITVALMMGAILGGFWFALRIANSERVQKLRNAHLRDTFARYVPESIVDEHAEAMSAIELGGEQRDVSVLFCDIRGFTSWAEKHEASEVITQLNELLGELTQAVFSTEGTLDKFTGDGLMALWGAPLSVEDHAARACECAREMFERLAAVNDRRLAQGLESFQIGVGIHSGPAVVGNVGHEKRLDYTAIGDTVNLAARLEAATKDLGSVVVVSRSTVDELGEDLRDTVMRIGTINVKGKEHGVEVFALSPRRRKGVPDIEEMLFGAGGADRDPYATTSDLDYDDAGAA